MLPRPVTNYVFTPLKDRFTYDLQFAVDIADEALELLKDNPCFGVHKITREDCLMIFINKNYAPLDVVTWISNQLDTWFASRSLPDELSDDDRRTPPAALDDDRRGL